MKKLLLTLSIALSLVLCGSAAAAGDGPQGKVLAQNSQAAPGAFQEAWAAEQQDLDQSVILIADHETSCKMFCPHYCGRCVPDPSPVKKEKWCEQHRQRAVECVCECD